MQATSNKIRKCPAVKLSKIPFVCCKSLVGFVLDCSFPFFSPKAHSKRDPELPVKIAFSQSAARKSGVPNIWEAPNLLNSPKILGKGATRTSG